MSTDTRRGATISTSTEPLVEAETPSPEAPPQAEPPTPPRVGERCSLRGCNDPAAGSRCFQVPVTSGALLRVDRYLSLCAAHLNALYAADVPPEEMDAPERGRMTAEALRAAQGLGSSTVGQASIPVRLHAGEQVVPLGSGKLTRLRSLTHALRLMRDASGPETFPRDDPTAERLKEYGSMQEAIALLEQHIVTLCLDLFPPPPKT